MFRPPYLARVAAGAAVYALEETRRLPTAAMNFPITAISQLLQTSMHVQQFVTSLALKGDAVFDRLGSTREEQPDWATFDEDLDSEQTFGAPPNTAGRSSRFDLFEGEEPDAATDTNGHSVTVLDGSEIDLTAASPITPAAETPENDAPAAEPEVATRYDYANMTLAQLRARLRMLTVEDLGALLDYEQRTRDRAPFVTMLTNRIATVRAQ
ncbi:lipid droplet-associated protein [Nocardia bovistercoris]|uniref:Lipid droplet-associated protein n=1 Tax=Nocardia bovistercoris TaxID=2785916 RepID=A0A931N1H9_9NOCA|nr:lipid droplet-associated protein [Nocardia bovistercoris]MBH0775984.1 lipid droplet-associated protein [Nocardia bovistercoris]